MRLPSALALALLLWSARPEGARALPCAEDDALADAATELLLEGAQVDDESLRRATRRAGSDAPWVRALVGPAARRESLRARLGDLARELGIPLRCGEAESGRRYLLLLSPAGGRLTLGASQPMRVHVELEPGVREPRLVVRDRDGRSARLAIEGGASEATLTLPAGLEPPIVVQLMGTLGDGPRPLAERTVGGAEAGRSVSVAASDVGEFVDALRSLRDRSMLRSNRILSEVARAHASAICRMRRAGHRSSEGLDPEERLERRGISARIVGEAVARARDLDGALSALAESPSHRLTLEDRRFTDLGHGVARDRDGNTCVVILLAAWPRYLGR